MVTGTPTNLDEAHALLKLLETKTHREYADEVGVGKASVTRWVKRANQIIDDIAPNQFIKGTSTLYGAEGDVKQQWVKTDTDKERQAAALREAFEGFSDKIPRAEPKPPPQICRANLLNLYVVTDLHVGMRGDDWNIKKAEQVGMQYIDEAMQMSVDAHTGVFVFQGDIAHFDSMKPVTPANRHVLDADCNSRTMNRVIIRLIRYAIENLLEKHQHVHFVYCAGNHDEYTAVVQSEWVAAHYENDPRVSVDTSNSLYHAYEWGLTSLYFHHGHKRGIGDVHVAFTATFPEIFGRTKYRYGHIGHYHHKTSNETSLMETQIHQTLSGKDDYANEGAWHSNRGAKVMTYCKEKGEKDDHTIRPEV